MQKSVKEWSTRTVLAGTLILAALPLVAVEMFPSQLKFVMDAVPYLVFHNIAEFFSIMVSLSMFGVGWFTYDQSRDRHALFLGTAFLAVGLIDFMHTMSMPAMPDFITTNLPNKSVQFWVAVRLLQGIAFLASAYVYPEKPSRWLTKKVLITSALLVSLLVFTGITFFPTYMPTTFVAGVGLTPFKKISEYLVIGLLGVATGAYWRRMERTGERLLIYYLAAFVICIFSELVFAFYTRMFDTYNVLGHIYKVAAFSLIYYGIYKASVKAPYLRLTEVGEELKGEIADRKRTEEALRESEKRLRLLSSQLLVGQEKERRLIAQEIHDSIGASLAASKFKVERALAQMSTDNPQTKDLLESVLPIIQETANEARRIQINLRPSILDDLGILATIGWFCRQYESTYSVIHVQQEIHIEEHEVSDSLKTVIFRILQEALNNIAKHSKANEVLLSLRKTDQTIQLVVRDNGHGFMAEDVLSRKRSIRGLGLDSMRERAELAGGTFTVNSTDSGTVIQASWPL